VAYKVPTAAIDVTAEVIRDPTNVDVRALALVFLVHELIQMILGVEDIRRVVIH
jgi:hypothetical protein